MPASWRLCACYALLMLPAALAAKAQDFGDCEAMVEITGAPEYLGEDPPEHKVLCRMGYLLSNNLKSKVPDWVVEVLTSDHLNGPAVRRDNFHADDDLTLGSRAELGDYSRNGFDRGHMAPAEDMTWDQAAMDQSFLLSNMAPQDPPFNRGIWARLEGMAREWADQHGRVVVITGPVYDRDDDTIGGNHVEVPMAFYKIVYNPSLRRAIGFQIPNKKQTGHHADDFIVKIRDIEDETGIDFLTGLSTREQNRLESVVPTMWRHIRR